MGSEVPKYDICKTLGSLLLQCAVLILILTLIFGMYLTRLLTKLTAILYDSRVNDVPSI
jgi:hypothetical protein